MIVSQNGWLMLTAYLDVSGHEGSHVIVAGFLGTDDQWKECAEKWKKGLGPQRKLLHMKELRFNKFGIKRMLEFLGAIPHACGSRAVMAATPVDRYKIGCWNPDREIDSGILHISNCHH